MSLVTVASMGLPNIHTQTYAKAVSGLIQLSYTVNAPSHTLGPATPTGPSCEHRRLWRGIDTQTVTAPTLSAGGPEPWETAGPGGLELKWGSSSAAYLL